MATLRIRRFRCSVVLASAFLLTSCEVLGITLGGSGRRAELERQQARWARQHITSYRLTYRLDCFCGAEFTAPTEIEVRDGVIVTARYADRADPIPVYVQAHLPTVDALFAIIAEAIDREADLLEVTYDPTRGYPTKIAIDYRFNTADDENTHSVSGFGIVFPPAVP